MVTLANYSLPVRAAGCGLFQRKTLSTISASRACHCLEVRSACGRGDGGRRVQAAEGIGCNRPSPRLAESKRGGLTGDHSGTTTQERRCDLPPPVERRRTERRAASGHVAAAPPNSVTNSRRFITRSPRRRGRGASAAPRGRAFPSLDFAWETGSALCSGGAFIAIANQARECEHAPLRACAAA